MDIGNVFSCSYIVYSCIRQYGLDTLIFSLDKGKDHGFNLPKKYLI